MAEPIRVLLADDHAIIREGLGKILSEEAGINIVGVVTNGQEAITRALELKPDVILMDIFMPGLSGLEATIEIVRRLPEAKVVIFTISDREEDLFQALRFGAHGYVLKSATTTEIAEAIRKTASGEAVLSPQMVSRLIAEFREKDNEPRLSTRETEVLDLLGNGFNNTQIAERLFIGESTVRTYIRRLLDKLHLRNRAEAIIYAAKARPNTKRI